MDPSDLGREGSNSATTLLASIERIVSLNEEKAALHAQIKDEMAAIKATGFDAKVVRKILARMKRDREEVEQEDALILTYEVALESARIARQF
jgi:uncharacterized protein (UPF0335 family)